jgi:hypothetical protein
MIEDVDMRQWQKLGSQSEIKRRMLRRGLQIKDIAASVLDYRNKL